MPTFYNLLALFCALFLSACIEKKDTATSAEPQSNIVIDAPYSFATMPGGSTGAAFMVIKNTGEADDRLIGAKSPIAGITEIHENRIDPDDGTMMMRKIRGLDISAGGQITLEPTGYHIMFIKLKEPLTMAQTVPVTLEFEKAGLQKIDVKIMPPGMRPEIKNHHGHAH